LLSSKYQSVKKLQSSQILEVKKKEQSYSTIINQKYHIKFLLYMLFSITMPSKSVKTNAKPLFTNSKKRPSVTVGEELWEIHLTRARNDSVDDHDYDVPPSPVARKRSRSIGEELWEVHLKRSENLELDVGEEDDIHHVDKCFEQEQVSCGSDNSSNEALKEGKEGLSLRSRVVPTLTSHKLS